MIYRAAINLDTDVSDALNVAPPPCAHDNPLRTHTHTSIVYYIYCCTAREPLISGHKSRTTRGSVSYNIMYYIHIQLARRKHPSGPASSTPISPPI